MMRKRNSMLMRRGARSMPSALGLAGVVLALSLAAAPVAQAGIIDRTEVTLGRLSEGCDRIVVGQVAAVAALPGGLGRSVTLQVEETVKGPESERLHLAGAADGPAYTLGSRVLVFLHLPRTVADRSLVSSLPAGALVGPATVWGRVLLDAQNAQEIIHAVRGRLPSLDSGDASDLRQTLLIEMASWVKRVAADAVFDLLAAGDWPGLGATPREVSLLDQALTACAERGVDEFAAACAVLERSGARDLTNRVTDLAWDLATRRPDLSARVSRCAGAALRTLDAAAASERLASLLGNMPGSPVSARAAAARLLGEVGGSAATDALAGLCGDSTPRDLRRAAVSGLARAAARDPRAVNVLLEALLRGSCRERDLAAAALCAAGSKRATGALRFAAGALDDDPRVRRLVRRLLSRPELARRILSRSGAGADLEGCGN